MQQNLNSREFANPHEALHELYQCFTHTELSEQLQLAEKQLLERSFRHKEGGREYDNTLFFFEKLQKLLQITNVLHRHYLAQRIQSDPIGKIGNN